MGGRLSSPSAPSSSPSPPSFSSDGVGDAGGLGVLQHNVLLTGLSHSGRSSVQSKLGIEDRHKFEIDRRFVTQPKIYGEEWDGNNYPRFMFDAGRSEGGALDKSVWSFGGRGGVRPRFAMIAASMKAIIMTVDSTDRARIAPQHGVEPLPDEFVAAYAKRSKQEQAEILATLEARLDAKSLLHNLLEIFSLQRRPVLILATKQDQPGAMSLDEIGRLLALDSIVRRDWRLSGCNAITGEGMAECVDWVNYVIAYPTDFRSIPYSPSSYVVHQRRLRRRSDAMARRMKYRENQIAQGRVPRAPPIFHTNGERWKPTPEQEREFIVAPITAEPEPEEEEEPDTVGTSQPMDQPITTVTVAEQPQAEEAEDAIKPATLANDLVVVNVDDSNSSPDSSSPSPSPDSVSSSRRGCLDSADSIASTDSESNSTDTDSDTGSATPTAVTVAPIELQRIDASNKDTIDVTLKLVGHADLSSPVKLSPKGDFGSFGSTLLVLPPRSMIPTVPLVREYVQQSWFRKSPPNLYNHEREYKMVPAPEAIKDITELQKRAAEIDWF